MIRNLYSMLEAIQEKEKTSRTRGGGFKNIHSSHNSYPLFVGINILLIKN